MGDCFETAGNIVAMFDKPGLLLSKERAAIELLTRMDVKQTDLRLVHGWVARPTDGFMHAHGWVEIPEMGLVLDYSNGHTALAQKERYYELGAIDGVKEYDYAEAQQFMVDEATYGPWDKMFNQRKETNDG